MKEDKIIEFMPIKSRGNKTIDYNNNQYQEHNNKNRKTNKSKIKNILLRHKNFAKIIGLGITLSAVTIGISKCSTEKEPKISTMKVLELNKDNTVLDECIKNVTITVNDKEVKLTDAVEKLDDVMKIIDITEKFNLSDELKKDRKINEKNKLIVDNEEIKTSNDFYTSEFVKYLFKQLEKEKDPDTRIFYANEIQKAKDYARTYIKENAKPILEDIQMYAVKAKTLDAMELNQKYISKIDINKSENEDVPQTTNNAKIYINNYNVTNTGETVSDKFYTQGIIHDVIENIYNVQTPEYDLSDKRIKNMIISLQELIENEPQIITQWFDDAKVIK